MIKVSPPRYTRYINIFIYLKNQLFMSKSKFAIQTYGKSEFAMLLFPDIDNPKVAQAKLLR